MRVYQVEYGADAVKALQKLRRSEPKKAELIHEKVKSLATAPRASNNNVTALKGRPGGYRLRIGDYRVIYEL